MIQSIHVNNCTFAVVSACALCQLRVQMCIHYASILSIGILFRFGGNQSNEHNVYKSKWASIIAHRHSLGNIFFLQSWLCTISEQCAINKDILPWDAPENIERSENELSTLEYFHTFSIIQKRCNEIVTEWTAFHESGETELSKPVVPVVGWMLWNVTHRSMPKNMSDKVRLGIVLWCVVFVVRLFIVDKSNAHSRIKLFILC